MSRRSLGVCYYPEQWPEDWWAGDARRMAELGIGVVRIGEFAWSRMEPEPGQLDLDWLARVIDTLHAEGLRVVLGTPTATPPKWLVDRMPDMLPVGRDGRVRGFGSRRHYCFSHDGYRREAVRITTALAERFGRHPGVVAWQTDNEYDCHDTAVSFSPAACAGFRDWLARRYQSPDALNRAWGNVFWSMEYRSFDEVDLPGGTVTEANPAHWMDFRRFTSDQVVLFNRVQVEVLRRLSPGRDVIHNFMGKITGFDHFDVGADLDVSSWDSYPLGFLEDRVDVAEDWRRRFARAGDPDFQALHHDLYRATSAGRWWVMEQQPGPVNWAPRNPAPRAGMVRLWTWEAFAHGAEVVSYFRWRQAPFAQEQMHAGLLRPDSVPAEGYHEAAVVAAEIAGLDLPAPGPAPVAIVFDYASAWAWEIQPQGREFSYFHLVFDAYRALRRMGLDVDILSPQTGDFGAARLVLIPGLFAWPEALRRAMDGFGGRLLVGPRSGSKTTDFAIPPGLPPGLPGLTVSRVESLRPDCPVPVPGGAFRFWREFVEAGPGVEVLRQGADGWPAHLRRANCDYLAGWPDPALMTDLLAGLAREAGLPVLDLPDGLRRSRCGPLSVWINYGDAPEDLTRFGGVPVIGSHILPPSGVAVLRD